jgi:hypothetical protein
MGFENVQKSKEMSFQILIYQVLTAKKCFECEKWKEENKGSYKDLHIKNLVSTFGVSFKTLPSFAPITVCSESNDCCYTVRTEVNFAHFIDALI